MIELSTPLSKESVTGLSIGDLISISGRIYTGRDMVLPKLVELYKSGSLDSMGINLAGSVIFHTAVSPAGVGPTSSNKNDIEGNIPKLSEAGVLIHLGKGALKKDTVRVMSELGSIYAVIPPVTALLESKIISRRVIAYEEYGMEAMFELDVSGFPAIVAAAAGESIYK